MLDHLFPLSHQLMEDRYGMLYGGARVDVNGDGIPDVRIGPYGQVNPEVGSFVPPRPYY